MEKILAWTRENGCKVELSFHGTPYRLRIGRMFRSVDPEGRIVPWIRAFGTKQPHQVLQTYKVKKIEILNPDGTIHHLESLQELLEVVGIL